MQVQAVRGLARGAAVRGTVVALVALALALALALAAQWAPALRR